MLSQICKTSTVPSCRVLKDAATGYVSVQTVCSVLRADLYRAWT